MDELPSKIEAQTPEILALSPGKPRIEFLPLIWDAAEAFTSPDLETRSDGLRRLVEYEAVRNHPLVAYLLYSRLTEPDIELRARIVIALADIFLSGQTGISEEQPASNGLAAWLSELRTRQIYSLLQVAEFDKNAEPFIACLLDQCSYAGEHLAEIISNRQTPLGIRKQAAIFVAAMGYMDALPVLERMASKLTQRRNGREAYGERESEDDECNLLPLIHQALAVLTAP
jgi:hypothetical protein